MCVVFDAKKITLKVTCVKSDTKLKIKNNILLVVKGTNYYHFSTKLRDLNQSSPNAFYFLVFPSKFPSCVMYFNQFF